MSDVRGSVHTEPRPILHVTHNGRPNGPREYAEGRPKPGECPPSTSTNRGGRAGTTSACARRAHTGSVPASIPVCSASSRSDSPSRRFSARTSARPALRNSNLRGFGTSVPEGSQIHEAALPVLHRMLTVEHPGGGDDDDPGAGLERDVKGHPVLRSNWTSSLTTSRA